MSEATRYGRKGGDLEPLKDGQYVAWDDYAALKAKNESLRKTGDALIRICEIHESNKDEYVIRWNAWQNAKESNEAK